MFETPLRVLSIVVSLFVLTGFVLFAVDETRQASAESQAAIAGRMASTNAAPTTGEERARERGHNGAREFIDDVNDVVLSPFAALSDSSETAWVRRGIPAMLALLVYGFGLATLARFGRGRA